LHTPKGPSDEGLLMLRIKTILFTLLFFYYAGVVQATNANSPNIWEEIETLLGQYKVEGKIKKMVVDEIRLSIPTLEYLRSQQKEDEIKGLVVKLKRAYIEKYPVTRDETKATVANCVMKLHILENKYQNFVKSYDIIFQKLQNPMLAMLEEVKLALAKEADYEVWKKAWMENKTLEHFDLYFEIGELLALKVNKSLEKSIQKIKNKQRLSYLQVELDHEFRIGVQQIGGMLICGRKVGGDLEHTFCMKVFEDSISAANDSAHKISLKIMQNPRNSYFNSEKFIQSYGIACLDKIKIDLFEKLAYR